MKRRKKLKKTDEVSQERKRSLFEEMGMRNDYKTRQAKEDFRRPAFEGTALEARRQQVTATPEGSRVAPPIIYHDLIYYCFSHILRRIHHSFYPFPHCLKAQTMI